MDAALYMFTLALFGICNCVCISEVDAPFARWSREQVCDWMHEQGLGLYVNLAKQWISSGQTLLQASQQNLEKVRIHFIVCKSP